MFNDPNNWNIFYKELKDKLGRDPSIHEMYEAKLKHYFSKIEEIEEKNEEGFF